MSKQKINPVRGMHDILPNTMQQFRRIYETAYEVSRLHGFEQIETPIVEFSEVFKRSLGDFSDVVNKEMYVFNSRKGEELVLRPENTASIVRSFISNSLQDKLPAKFFYNGPMFRYERPQKGRQRQFHQIGVELLGGGHNPMVDIDVILCGYEILKRLGLENRITLDINTLGELDERMEYQRVLVKYLDKHAHKLSQDSQQRLKNNPLRILDSKDEQDQEIIETAPTLEDFFSDKTRLYFLDILNTLQKLGIKINCNPYLVRGLDYYCHTVFEFITNDLGTQGTVLAGGRYNGLVQALGGKDIDGVGWAAGVERLALMLDEPLPQVPDVALIAIPSEYNYKDEGEEQVITMLAHELRGKNISTNCIYSGSLKKRMQRANQSKADFAIIVGLEELTEWSCVVKHMESGEEIIAPSHSGIGKHSAQKIKMKEKMRLAINQALEEIFLP